MNGMNSEMNAEAEKILGDIICIAEGAIGGGIGESEEERTPLYAAALERIRDLVRRDWLDMGDFRLTRFHVDGNSLFVGTRKSSGMLLEGHACRIDERFCKVRLDVNGHEFFSADVYGGLTLASRILVGAIRGFCAYRAANRRHGKKVAE